METFHEETCRRATFVGSRLSVGQGRGREMAFYLLGRKRLEEITHIIYNPEPRET